MLFVSLVSNNLLHHEGDILAVMFRGTGLKMCSYFFERSISFIHCFFFFLTTLFHEHSFVFDNFVLSK